jgi:hypothetical protein
MQVYSLIAIGVDYAIIRPKGLVFPQKTGSLRIVAGKFQLPPSMGTWLVSQSAKCCGASMSIEFRLLYHAHI